MLPSPNWVAKSEVDSWVAARPSRLHGALVEAHSGRGRANRLLSEVGVADQVGRRAVRAQPRRWIHPSATISRNVCSVTISTGCPEAARSFAR
jgi:hypothetical protein